MKNKKIVTLILSVVLIGMLATSVFADGGPTDLTNSILNPGGNTNNQTPNQPKNETTNQTPNTTPNVKPNVTPSTNTNTSTGNDASSYQESKLPQAGLEDTMLLCVAYIVCGIIGVYTFIKLSEYSNI